MDDYQEILDKISHTNLTYTLHVDGKVFNLEKVAIAKSTIPVRKPTTRGGVYFTDTTAYKMRATTNDMLIIELLPKLMLGPNSEFRSLAIKTNVKINDVKRVVTLLTHVANTMNTKTKVELNLIVDKIKME
jgi:hypothetical protein